MTREPSRALAPMMDTSLPSSDTAPATAPVTRDLADEPEVAAFLATVRDEYRTSLPATVTSQHLRMILAEAAVAPSPTGAGARWARRARRVAAVGAVKIALTATAAAAVTGTGLAATGSLPDAAQTVVAEAAERVGITFPTPASHTPGDRTDDAGEPKPGIGEGGVPALLDRPDLDPADLPGRAGDAPGHQKDEDGRPARPETGAADDAADAGQGAEHGNAGGAERGTDRAETAPVTPPASGTAQPEDTPPDDTPADDSAPAERPEAPAKPAAAVEGDEVADEQGGEQPAARPEGRRGVED